MAPTKKKLKPKKSPAKKTASKKPTIKTWPDFRPRFMTSELVSDLASMWHLSRTAVGHDHHARCVWTAKHFAQEKGLSETGVYKDLTAMLEYGRRFG